MYHIVQVEKQRHREMTIFISQKYAGNIHGMSVAGIVTKRKGFSLVFTISNKN